MRDGRDQTSYDSEQGSKRQMPLQYPDPQLRTRGRATSCRRARQTNSVRSQAYNEPQHASLMEAMAESPSRSRCATRQRALAAPPPPSSSHSPAQSSDPPCWACCPQTARRLQHAPA